MLTIGVPAWAGNILLIKPEDRNTYTLYISTAGMPSSALDAVELAARRAAGTYTNDPTSSLTITFGGTTTEPCSNTLIVPGTMRICWMDAFGAVGYGWLNSSYNYNRGTYTDAPWIRLDPQHADMPRYLSDGEMLCRLILHEMGHVLGLQHEYDVPSVMGSSQSCALSPDDRNTLALLYPPQGRDQPLHCAFTIGSWQDETSDELGEMWVPSAGFNGRRYSAFSTLIEFSSTTTVAEALSSLTLGELIDSPLLSATLSRMTFADAVGSGIFAKIEEVLKGQTLSSVQNSPLTILKTTSLMKVVSGSAAAEIRNDPRLQELFEDTSFYDMLTGPLLIEALEARSFFQITEAGLTPNVPLVGCGSTVSFDSTFTLNQMPILDYRDGGVYLYDLRLNLERMRLEILSKELMSDIGFGLGVETP